MKKILTVLALTLMTVIMAVTVAGCASTDTAAIDKLTERIEALEKENEDIKKKNNDLQNQLNNLNVFWTDKKEYSSTETMTVYFGQTAAFKIRLGSDSRWSGTEGINYHFYLTSLCADILKDTIATSTYLSWNNGTYMPAWTSNATIAKKDVEKQAGGYYKGDSAAYNSATSFDFVICVPGTPFELARFKNVTVKK